MSTWEEWSNHVIRKLDDLDRDFKEIHKELSEIKIEIAMLKVKSGLWGSLGASIPIVFFYFFGK